MSNEELARKVEHVLQRELTSEEHKFLALATKMLSSKDDSAPASKVKAAVT